MYLIVVLAQATPWILGAAILVTAAFVLARRMNLPMPGWLRRTPWVVVLLLSILLGYPAVGVADHMAAQWRMKLICDAEAGYAVREPVTGVDGIELDEIVESPARGCGATCKELVAIYDFVEVRVEDPDPRYLAVEPGLHRYALVRRPSPRCATFDALAQGHSRIAEVQGVDLSEVCVAVEMVPSPASRYLASGEFSRDYIGEMLVLRWTYSFIDKVEDRLVGLFKNLTMHDPSWGVNAGGPTRHCPEGSDWDHFTLSEVTPSALIPE